MKAQKPRVKVEGARKVWATHPHATVKTIENVVARFCSISEGLRIRRKTHRNGSSGKTSWWFIIHGNENVQCELDEKWDCVHLQTSWILKPCTKPVDIDITDPISSTQTGDKLPLACKQRRHLNYYMQLIVAKYMMHRCKTHLQVPKVLIRRVVLLISLF